MAFGADDDDAQNALVRVDSPQRLLHLSHHCCAAAAPLHRCSVCAQGAGNKWPRSKAAHGKAHAVRRAQHLRERRWSTSLGRLCAYRKRAINRCGSDSLQLRAVAVPRVFLASCAHTTVDVPERASPVESRPVSTIPTGYRYMPGRDSPSAVCPGLLAPLLPSSLNAHLPF